MKIKIDIEEIKIPTGKNLLGNNCGYKTNYVLYRSLLWGLIRLYLNFRCIGYYDNSLNHLFEVRYTTRFNATVFFSYEEAENTVRDIYNTPDKYLRIRY